MLTATHAMQTDVESVSPEMRLVDLERRFLMLGMSGFPVVEQGALVGIVSRSDVLRMLSVERAAEEQLSEFYRTFDGRPLSAEDAAAESAAIAARVGERAAGLTVRDAMIRRVITVEADRPLSEVVRMMLDGHIHRLPVLANGRLVGLVTTLDIARLVAEGQLVEAPAVDGPTERLLSGGEQPAERFAGVRKILEGRLDALIARTTAIEGDLRTLRDPDSQERAVERENDEVLERLAESELRHVSQVRQALSRLATGEYDACEQCGEPVGRARQGALPEATRCLACS